MAHGELLYVFLVWVAWSPPNMILLSQFSVKTDGPLACRNVAFFCSLQYKDTRWINVPGVLSLKSGIY